MKVTLHYFPPPIEQEVELPPKCPGCERVIDKDFIPNGIILEERVRNLEWKAPLNGQQPDWHPAEEGDPGDIWITAVVCSWCATQLAEATAPPPLEHMAHDLEHNSKKEK